LRPAQSLAPVVLDINVLVAAVVGQDPEAAFESWPSPPPLRGDPSANAVGVLNDAVEFSLWLSPHILEGTKRVLLEFYRWSDTRAARYEKVLITIAARSGGDVVVPTETVADCDDWEDNRILELALESGALLIVSSDAHLLAMSPWRGIPVVDAAAFVARVDAMRRARFRAERQRRPKI
jgi:predicted nucleic acid-binding protein